VALAWNTVDYPLIAGIDTGIDPRALEAPHLAKAINAKFSTRGGISLRHPYSALASVPGTVRKLAAYRDELLLFTDTGLYSWSPGLNDWQERADYLAPKVTEQTRFASPAEQLFADRAELDGVAVYVWQEGATSDAKIAALDVETGAVLLEPQAIPGISGVHNPRVLVVGETFHLFALETFDAEDQYSDVYLTVIDPADVGDTSQWSTPVVAISAGARAYDVAAADGFSFVVARPPPVGLAVFVRVHDESGTFVEAQNTAVTADGALSIAARGSGAAVDVAVAQVNGTNVVGSVFVFDGVDTLTATGTDVDIGNVAAADNQITTAFRATAESGGEYRCYAVWSSAETASSTSFNFTRSYIDTEGNAESTAGTTIALRTGLASHAFAHADGHVYVWGVFACESGTAGMAEPLGFRAALQNTYFLYQVDGGLNAYVAKAAPGVAGGFGQITRHLPGVQDLGDGRYAFMGVERRVIPLGDFDDDDRAVATSYAARTPRETVVEFDSNEARRTAETGRTLYLTGGEVLQYDGQSVVELGWPVAPWYFAAAPLGSGSQEAGTRAYKATLSGENAQGELDRSTTATHGSVTLTANQEAVFSVAGINHTRRPTAALELWRTIREAPVGAPFYLVTGLNPNTVSGDNAYLQNTRTGGFATTFTDDFTDDEVIEKSPNPENVGVLENMAPPPAALIAAARDRLFLAGVAGNPYQVRYSKYRAAGEVANFNDLLSVDLPAQTGAVTALAVMNEVAVVFTEQAVYALAGDGHDNLGGGANYEPQLITPDVGAVSAEAVGVTADGVVFKSQRGWHALNRGLAVQYIGGPVEEFDGESVVAVTVVEDQHEVRCLTASRAMVLNTKTGQWATWSIEDAVDAVVWQGSYVYATEDGVFVEREDYTGVDYELDVETAWVRFGNLVGFGRARRFAVLGDVDTTVEPELRVRVAYNDNETWVDDTVVELPASSSLLRRRFRFSKQKVSSVKVRLTLGDDASPGTLRETSLTGLTFELGMRGGVGRLPETQSH
jgi:hypothetical protein